MCDDIYDLIVIGAGSAGVRVARVAASLGAKVAIVEDTYIGGTCVNVGCIPKKLYVIGSSFPENIIDAEGYGWKIGSLVFDWAKLRSNKETEISRLNKIYGELLLNSDVEVIRGKGTFVNSKQISVNSKLLSAKYFVIASGGWPFQPDLPGIDLTITSNQVFDIKELPKKILIVGGGYIAIEFAGIFSGLGVDTTLSYRGSHLLKNFDREITNHLLKQLQIKGIKIHLDHNVFGFRSSRNSIEVDHSGEFDLNIEQVLMAVGRIPNTRNLGLEFTKVSCAKNGSIETFDNFMTADQSIFAIGDVAGSIELTPVALAEGQALAHYLFGDRDSATVDCSYIPTTVFSQPSLGTIGLTEEEVISKGLVADVYVSKFRPLRNTISDRKESSFFKLLVDVSNEKVIGIHLLGPDAGEILQGFAVALKAGATKIDFDSTIGIHPTAAEELVTMRKPIRRIG